LINTERIIIKLMWSTTNHVTFKWWKTDILENEFFFLTRKKSIFNFMYLFSSQEINHI
jgi:hypothetical protein